MPTVRFAPSPTGYLHLGNARTALVNWLFARQRQGRFILRIDDTDRARSQAGFEEAIREDLAWLGLDWDAQHRQSERAALHEVMFRQLQAAGRVYPCHETAEELARWRQDRLDRSTAPVFKARDRFAPAAGRAAYWRFCPPEGEIGFEDLLLGARRFAPASLSDPVVLREDGSVTYLFASAVDDLDLGVSHVIRGEDHVTNTALQLAILQGLDAPPPRFAHLPLIGDAAGQPFSKRLGDLSLRALREQGIEPLAIVLALEALGTPRAADPSHGMADLLRLFSLEAYGRAPPRLDLDDLPRFSASVLHHRPFAAVAGRLKGHGVHDPDETFWRVVRPNIERLAEAKPWWDVCREPLTPVVTDPELLRAAAETLPLELDEPAFAAWTAGLRTRTGRKGKALFQPLRLALTAREHGPELKHLLPLIGRERALRRLRGETA